MHGMSESRGTPIIALLTDMGHSDWYVGAMKGVILSICPDAHLIDLCHEVAKQDIAAAAFILKVSHRFFPDGTVFLVVVDPEVGSPRRAIVATDGARYYVAPDNGLLTYLEIESPQWRVRAIENPAMRLNEVSETFHGRDLFAPTAAHLAAGEPFESVGSLVPDTVRLPHIQKVQIQDRILTGRIIYIDSYGNLLTNVTPDMLPDAATPDRLKMHFKGHTIQGLTPHFAAVPQSHPLMYWGSSGVLEIAINYGSAARRWSAQVGEWFELEWGE